MGINAQLEPAIDVFDVRPGDILLLCSDGLCGLVSDDEIRHILLSAKTADEAGDALYEAAKNAGGDDNVTVVLYTCCGWPREQEHPAPTGEAARQRRRRDLQVQLVAWLLVLLLASLLVTLAVTLMKLF